MINKLNFPQTFRQAAAVGEGPSLSSAGRKLKELHLRRAGAQTGTEDGREVWGGQYHSR